MLRKPHWEAYTIRAVIALKAAFIMRTYVTRRDYEPPSL
jgi:hypothetical protein